MGALYHRDDAPAGVRIRLAAEILNRFFSFYNALPERSFMEEYKQRSLLTGMKITYLRGESVQGRPSVGRG